MATVAVYKATSAGFTQTRIPHFALVKYLMNGYHLVPRSLIITKEL